MSDRIVIEVRPEKKGVKVNTKGESNKVHERKRKIKLNGIRCANELKELLKFQSEAIIHLFKFSFYSLVWLGDTFLLIGDNLGKMNKKKTSNKGENKNGLF